MPTAAIGFHTTHWTLVLAAGAEESASAQEALAGLCSIYWYPLYAFIPMAQDFYAAFGLGGSDTTITGVDPDGVALAAIQGLNEKLEQNVQQKETEITELRTRLEKLERLMSGR